MALTDVKSEQIQSSVALAGSPTTTTQSASDNSTKIATTAYVETAVANLVASAPAALNTLDELAAALNDDASFSTNVTNSIAAKLPLAGGTMTGDIISQDNRGIKFGTGSDTSVYNDGSNFYIKNNTLNQDIIFQGNDDGSTGTTVLTLDMSNAGKATFNAGAAFGNDVTISGGLTTSETIYITGDNHDLIISSNDYENVYLGNRGASGTNLDKGYFRLKSEGTNTVVIDTAANSYFNGGNVGIGTSSPSSLLHLKSASPQLYMQSNDGNAASIVFGDVSDASRGQIKYESTDDMVFLVNNLSPKLTIKNGGDVKIHGGNLGIGMDAVQALDIDRTSGLSIRFYESGTFRAGLQVVTGAGQMVGTSAVQDFAIRSQSNLLFATNGNTERMKIDGNGNVGIGTTNPTKKLHVIGDSNEGIHLKVGAQIPYAPTSSTFYSGLTFENTGSGHAYSIGYGQGGRIKFSYFDNSSTYEELAHIRPGGDIYPAGSVVLQSGEGINFSATSQASGMSSELLDDYEEGTWTPVLIAETTNPTGGGAINPQGSYTKIGNRVFATYYVGRSWTNTPAGGIFVSGLPFTVNSTGANTQYHYVATYNVNFGGGMTMGVPIGGGGTVRLYAVNNNSGWTSINWTTHTNGTTIYLSGSFSYIV